MKGLKRWGVASLIVTLLVCAVGWLGVAALCMCMGSTGHFSWPSDPAVFRFRREYVLLASLVGAVLASAGVVYQSILRNPLADPYLLGVSSGASLAAFVWRFSWWRCSPRLGAR